MKLIFLDIDGVLNDHRIIAATNCCGINPMNVERFNRLLLAVPDAKIVLSSAWRYMIIVGDMTLKGFEYMLATHGVACEGRIIGITETDANLPELDEEDPDYDSHLFVWGLDERNRQITAAVEKWKPEKWVILDDLPLNFMTAVFVKTDGETGLSDDDVRRALAILDAEVPA